MSSTLNIAHSSVIKDQEYFLDLISEVMIRKFDHDVYNLPFSEEIKETPGKCYQDNIPET